MSSFTLPAERPRTPAALPEELGFGRYFTERMFVERYEVEHGWHGGAVVPYGPLQMDPAAQLFHCGQAIFEGMKALRRPDGGVNLFRADERIDIEELLRDVERGEVSEVFCIGTAAVVAPIGRIGFRGRDYQVSGAQSAAVTRRLYQGLTDLQYGRMSDPYGWSVPLDVEAAAAL